MFHTTETSIGAYLLLGFLDFCIEGLEGTLESYGAPEILNTDQGSQFTPDEFIESVLDRKIRFSMDGQGSKSP